MGKVAFMPRKEAPKVGEHTRTVVAYKPRRVSGAEIKKAVERGRARQPKDPSRVFEFIASSERVDRMGDIVRQKWNLKDYKKNPVILFAHNSDEIIGRSIMEEVRNEGRGGLGRHLAIWVEYAGVQHNPLAERMHRMTRDGFLNAGSVGFMPTDVYNPESDEERQALGLGPWGVEFRKNDLMEFSPCAIPANPDALVQSTKAMARKGYDEETIQMLKSLAKMTADPIDKTSVVKDDDDELPLGGGDDGDEGKEGDLLSQITEKAEACKGGLQEILDLLDADAGDEGEDTEEVEESDDSAEEREEPDPEALDTVRSNTEAAMGMLQEVLDLANGVEELDDNTTAEIQSRVGEAMVAMDEVLTALGATDDNEDDSESDDGSTDSDSEEESDSKTTHATAKRAKARRTAASRSGAVHDLLQRIKTNFEA